MVNSEYCYQWRGEGVNGEGELVYSFGSEGRSLLERRLNREGSLKDRWLNRAFTLKDKSGVYKICVKKLPYQLLNTN